MVWVSWVPGMVGTTVISNISGKGRVEPWNLSLCDTDSDTVVTFGLYGYTITIR